jgi:O-antigen ligase
MLNPHFDRIKRGGFLVALVGVGFSISFCGIGLAIYLIGLLLQALFDRQYSFRVFPHAKLLFFLSASLLVSFFTSPLMDESARGLFKYFEGFVFLYAGVDLVRSRNDVWKTLGIIAVVWLVAGLDAMYQDIYSTDLLNGIYISKQQLGRITGPYKQPTDFGVFLAAGLAVSVGALIESFQKRRNALFLLSLILSVLLAVCLIKTFSRGALIAFVGSMIFLAMFYRSRYWVLAVIAAMTAALILIPSPWSTRLTDIFTMSRGSTAERLVLLETSWNMIKTKPLFGLGLNTYSHFFPQFKPDTYPALMYAHNGYVQMATEAGLVGVTLYLLFIGGLITTALKGIMRNEFLFDKNIQLAFIAAVVAVLLNCFFESVFQSSQLRTLLWLFLGVAVASAYRDNRKLL